MPDTTNCRIFGKRIRFAMLQAGFNNRQLATATGMTTRAVDAWRAGIAYPRALPFMAMCSSLGVSAEWLLRVEDVELPRVIKARAATSTPRQAAPRPPRARKAGSRLQRVRASI
jgi:transcriptional regulator with XRE-family HTH domain